MSTSIMNKKTICMTGIAGVLCMLSLSPALSQTASDRALPIDEYNDIPKGLLLEKGGIRPGETRDGTATGTTQGSMTDDGSTLKHMSFDTAQKLYRQGQFADALGGLVPLANSGNPGALEILGIMTRMGQGVEKNPAKAAEYLTKAANENRALAQHHLGVMYFTGDGVDMDVVQALSWLQLAILHYPAGAEKQRALQDRDAIYKQINRRDREAAMKLTREFLERKGEAHLMDFQE